MEKYPCLIMIDNEFEWKITKEDYENIGIDIENPIITAVNIQCKSEVYSEVYRNQDPIGNYFYALPIEIHSVIFSFIKFHNLLTLRKVSKKMNFLVSKTLQSCFFKLTLKITGSKLLDTKIPSFSFPEERNCETMKNYALIREGDGRLINLDPLKKTRKILNPITIALCCGEREYLTISNDILNIPSFLPIYKLELQLCEKLPALIFHQIIQHDLLKRASSVKLIACSLFFIIPSNVKSLECYNCRIIPEIESPNSLKTLLISPVLPNENTLLKYPNLNAVSLNYSENIPKYLNYLDLTIKNSNEFDTFLSMGTFFTCLNVLSINFMSKILINSNTTSHNNRLFISVDVLKLIGNFEFANRTSLSELISDAFINIKSLTISSLQPISTNFVFEYFSSFSKLTSLHLLFPFNSSNELLPFLNSLFYAPRNTLKELHLPMSSFWSREAFGLIDLIIETFAPKLETFSIGSHSYCFTNSEIAVLALNCINNGISHLSLRTKIFPTVNTRLLLGLITSELLKHAKKSKLKCINFSLTYASGTWLLSKSAYDHIRIKRLVVVDRLERNENNNEDTDKMPFNPILRSIHKLGNKS